MDTTYTAETGCKGWAQQPARITELLTRKYGKVYGDVLEFWKEDGAAVWTDTGFMAFR